MLHRMLSALVVAILARPGFALQTDRQYGEASFKFLKLSLSPRATALGGAGAALLDGIGDADLNPAAAARDSGALALGQGYPFQAFSATGSQIAWNLPWDNRRVTLHARYLGYDDIPGYDASGQPTAAYAAYTLKLQAGLAGNLWGFAYGASLAFAQNNIAADADYRTGLVNVGLMRSLPFGFALGLAALNADFWTSTAKDGSLIFPPTTLQAGLAYSRSLPENIRASVALDARTRNDEQIAFPAGLEASWKDLLWVRAGWPFAEPEPALSLGLGLRWSRFGFDYAYQGHAVMAGGHTWALEVRY